MQIGIDQYRHRFLPSGSSARKLRRGGVSFLGGRALDLRLHPLTYLELGREFKISLALSYGTLPSFYNLANPAKLRKARRVLQAYSRLY